MNPDDFDIPLYNQRLTSEAYTWSTLQQCLEEHRKQLEDICAEEGSHAASIAQEELMKGMNDRVLMERMFLEGRWRSPGDNRLIKKTRGDYFILMTPLLPAEERQNLEILQGIHDCLKEILEKLHKGEAVDSPFDLERMHETVQLYNGFARRSEEAQNLINDIMRCISQLAQLQEK